MGLESVTVRVYDGRPDVENDGAWQTLSNVSDVRLRRAIGSGEASFRVNDASLAQLQMLRGGRECDVAITVDGTTVTFGGFVDQTEIEVVTPGSFNLRVRLTDLTTGMRWHLASNAIYNPGADWATIIKDQFDFGWNLRVDTSGVANTGVTNAEEYQVPPFDTMAAPIEDIVRRFLPDYFVQVKHNGSSNQWGIHKKLALSARDVTDKTGSVELGGDDIPVPFSIRPVVDPRSDIFVVGESDSEVDTDAPVANYQFDTNSRAAYGVRYLVVKHQSNSNAIDLNNAALALLEENRWELWETTIRLTDWTLEPGDKVLIHLPELGLVNVSVGTPWVLEEVEERVNQGKVERHGRFVEHSDSAFVRVS